MFDLVEPGGLGARSRREQVLDFKVLVGAAEQYFCPCGEIGTLSIRRALPQSASSRRGVRRDRRSQIGGREAPRQWCRWAPATRSPHSSGGFAPGVNRAITRSSLGTGHRLHPPLRKLVHGTEHLCCLSRWAFLSSLFRF
jgi:hypothetical protein